MELHSGTISGFDPLLIYTRFYDLCGMLLITSVGGDIR